MCALERPTFYEGQVLAARDLAATVDHPRDQLARHSRYLHSWGIAEGLELRMEQRSTVSGTNPVPYVDVTLGPGYAVDGTGREVVVTDPVPVSPILFEQINPNAVGNAWYPVFLRGRDEARPEEGRIVGRCEANGQPTRVTEAFEVTFGRLGDERDVDQQIPPAVGAGPGGAITVWQILVGFVCWNPAIQRFANIALEANGVRLRRAGVIAGTVAARDGRLTLQTRVNAESGRPAVVIDDRTNELTFGLFDGTGTVSNPVFTVNADGDVTAKGTIHANLQTGAVHVQSGTATDGIVLPLPPGITDEQVSSGQATLHVQVTPRVPGSAPPDPSPLLWQFPLECRVDSNRRVRCRVRWFIPAGLRSSLPETPVPPAPLPPHFPTVEDRPAACDYLVIASVPPVDGAGQ